jgi:hypothetical protein
MLQQQITLSLPLRSSAKDQLLDAEQARGGVSSSTLDKSGAARTSGHVEPASKAPARRACVNLVVIDDTKPFHSDLGLYIPRSTQVLMPVPGVRF